MMNLKNKLSLMWILVALPIVILAYLSIHRIYIGYQFTQKELLITRYHANIYSALLNAQQLRGEIYLNSGTQTEAANIASLKEQLQQNIHLIDKDDFIAKLLNVQADWAEAKKQLLMMFGQPLKLNEKSIFTRHSVSIDNLVALLTEVARNSYLVLAPAINSYDTLNTMVNIIPNETDLLSYWRGKIAGLNSMQQRLSDSEYLELIAAISRLENLESLKKINQSKSAQNGLILENINLDKEIALLKVVASGQELKNPQNFFKEMTSAVEALHQEYLKIQQHINQLLNERSHLLMGYILAVLAMALIAGLSCVWFVKMSIKNHRKQLEAADQLKSVFDSVVSALFVIDQHGVIQTINLTAIKLFGYTEVELLGNNLDTLMEESHKKVYLDYLNGHIVTNNIDSTRCEVLGRHRNGSTFAIDFVITKSEIYGKVMYIAAVQNIERRIVAERAAIEQKEQFMQLVENQSVATFLIDAEHRILHWNRACEALTGVKAEDVIGTTEAWRGFYPEARPCLANLVLDKCENLAKNYYSIEKRSELKENGWHAEAWFDSLGGKTRYVIFDAVPIVDSTGKITAVIESLQDLTAIKIAEQALAEEKEKALQVAKLLEHQKYTLDQHAIVATTDAKGSINYVNDKFCEISGYAKEELLGKNHNLLNSGHHPKQFFKEMYATIAKGKVWNAEICNRNKHGDIYWVNTTIVPFMGENGKPNEYIAIRNDITDSKKASEALLIAAHKELESNQQIKALFDTVIDGLIVINEQGIIQTANPATTKIFGYSNEELVGQNVKMLMPDKQKREHDGYINNYRNTGDAKIIGKGREVIGKRKDGTTFAMDLGINETTIDGKRMFVGTTRDVSERRHMERLYRLMSENVEGYATLIIDPQGNVRTWNAGAQMLHGYTAEEIIGKPINKFYTDEDIATQLPAKLLEASIKEGHVHNEGWRVRKDGSQFYAEVVLNSLQEDDGSLLGFVKVTRDVTARKQLDNELKQAYSNLEEFTAVASHDLKSPIRGIADLVDWIKEDLGENIIDDVKLNLDRVQLRVKRMEVLIEDLLQYSRAGKVSAAVTLVEPVALVEEILELQPFPEGFNVTISGSSPSFNTAKTPLQTALRNLISNAVKHHDKTQGNISIDVKTQGSFCIFSIQDDGPGIPESAQERVFKLFQTLSKSAESSGIGLAVSKRMVEAHGGYIKLESIAEARGTTFCIWWPRFNINVIKD
jgi:PAS domain S-box-containing protein